MSHNVKAMVALAMPLVGAALLSAAVTFPEPVTAYSGAVLQLDFPAVQETPPVQVDEAPAPVTPIPVPDEPKRPEPVKPTPEPDAKKPAPAPPKVEKVKKPAAPPPPKLKPKPKPVESAPELYVLQWSANWCPACGRWRQDEMASVNVMTSTIDHDQFGQFSGGVTRLPSFEIREKKTERVLRRLSGYQSARVINAEIAKLRKARKATRQPRLFRTAARQKWSVSGARNPWNPTRTELLNHLLNQPHAKVSFTTLNTLTRMQLIALHDDEHEGVR